MNNLAETASFLSRVFIKEVDESFIEQARLFLQEWDTASAAALPVDFSQGLVLLDAAMAPGADSKEQLEALAVAYAKLFLGVGEKPVPLFESVYTSTDKLLFEAHYFEVLEFYDEWGYEVPKGFLEAADHLAVELDFLATRIGHIEALLTAGQHEAAQRQQTAAQTFTTSHLNVWVPQACEDILAISDCDLYRAAALLTGGLLQAV